ncbi:hypothetical protein Hanom_Chr13g01232101 [Helianthus anomalus]
MLRGLRMQNNKGYRSGVGVVCLRFVRVLDSCKVLIEEYVSFDKLRRLGLHVL